MRPAWMVVAALALLVLGACSAGRADQPAAGESGDAAARAPAPVTLEQGERLRVVATTSIIADVVANVGGEYIALTQLIPTGVDPHGFTPAPQDVRALNDAHAIFINGLGLEESLLPVLENLDRPVPLITVNEGVAVIGLDGPAKTKSAEENEENKTDHDHGAVDPHTWFSVPNVQVWTGNIADALSALDPAHAADYVAAAAAYNAALGDLDAELRSLINTVPEEARKVAADHQALGYLATEYGIRTVGAVVPSFSTLASGSAQEMAALQETIRAEGVRAILAGTTVNPQTASQLAQDLDIRVVPIYTGSLSEAGGPASTYIAFMRSNITAIVEALR